MKLHLGCGKKYLKDFVHIDIAEFSHIDYQSSVDNLSFLDENSVEEIYSSHTFEYFDRKKAEEVLREWLRVLTPEGNLYLTVPDFDSLIEIYKITGNLEKIIGPLFGKWLNSNASEPIFHRTVWNRQDLTLLLEQVGFGKVKVFHPKIYLQTIDPAYDDYSLAYFPHMDSTGIQVSLALTATKIH